jgi:hypothetical protein
MLLGSEAADPAPERFELDGFSAFHRAILRDEPFKRSRGTTGCIYPRERATVRSTSNRSMVSLPVLSEAAIRLM